MQPTLCPTQEVLEGVALGREAPPQVRAHLSTCEPCRQALKQIRDNNLFLSGFAIGGALPVAEPITPSIEMEIPGYTIVRRIHQGGQGVVYQAIQRSTRRDVAVKVMKQGRFATLADRARFEREIETLGGLNHPNIVAVHDAGTSAGFQYFVMNYIDGQPLDEAFARSESTAGIDRAEAVLTTFVKICDAVHAAHLRGIIHRDLKPSNIRVDASGEPHVLDFGLAKSVEQQPDSAMTQTGQFVGSLPWASPEQIEGVPSRIDLRTDVYSLGAILYQLLTGQPPFDVGSSLRHAFDMILLRDPPRPSAAAAAAGAPPIDDELDTIVMKCLAKDRERRYQIAGEIAEDLRRYLAGDPIEAKRDSAIYMLRKTLRRYRMRVAVAGSFVVLAGLFSVLMAFLYQRSNRLEHQAVQSAARMAELLSQSNIEQGRMASVLGNMEQAEQLLWRELFVKNAPTTSSGVSLNLPPGPSEAFWALWELYRTRPCLRTMNTPLAPIRTLTLADDGQSVWIANELGFIQRVDLLGNPTDAYRVAFNNELGYPQLNARGTVLINHDVTRFGLWRRDAGEQPVTMLPPTPDASFGRVSVSGRRVAVLLGDNVCVWNTDPLQQIATIHSSERLVAVALSNDDRKVAARNELGSVMVWDIETGRVLAEAHSPVPSRNAPHARGGLLFSPDDRMLGDAWMEIAGRIWDLSSDPPQAVELSERPGDTRVQNFSPDSRLLAVADDGGTVRVFDTRSGRRLTSFVAHPGRVMSVAFTRDNRCLWTCSEAGLRVWEIPNPGGVNVMRTEGDRLHGLDVSPDGRQLAAGGGLGKLIRVDRATGETTNVDFGNAANISSIAFSSDSNRIAIATYGQEVFLLDAANAGNPLRRFAHQNLVSHVCFSPDGERLASACDDGVVRVWRVSDGTLEREFPVGGLRIPRLAFSGNGRQLAAAIRDGRLMVWDTESGQGYAWSPATGMPLRAVRYSADGRWLASAGADRTVDLWDVASRQRVASLVGHSQEVYDVDISPDGRLVASGDTGGVIRLWDLGLRRQLATFEGHSDAVMALRFSPDGRSLVSVSLDGTIRDRDLGYHDRHIAGQVEFQLRRIEKAEGDESARAAWQDWAAGVLARPAKGRLSGSTAETSALLVAEPPPVDAQLSHPGP